jgi:hypothetical protein|nr:MAG TPA_asm: hypothetical protein [Caudoviricetes sp.]
MHELQKVLEKQLETERKEAINKLTSNNLDTIFKLTTAICNIKKLEGTEREHSAAPTAEIAEEIIRKYSNGRYDHNVDALYDAYIAAKQAYKQTGDQGHRDKLMESVGRLMVEIYDLLSSMIVDSDFQEEKKEIMHRIRMLSEQ